MPSSFSSANWPGVTNWAWIITGRMSRTGRSSAAWAARQQRMNWAQAASPLQWARSCTPSDRAVRTKPVTSSSVYAG